MGHNQPPTPAVTDRATGDGFFNDNIHQRHSRAIYLLFYWVRDIFIQGQFLVYWMAGEQNLADYFTKHHTTSHHQSQRSIYIVTTADSSKYTCYMSPIDLRGCVESLPDRGNGRRAGTVCLLHEKEVDDGWTETNRPNRPPRYCQR